jgi:hypothetical protein
LRPPDGGIHPDDIAAGAIRRGTDAERAAAAGAVPQGVHALRGGSAPLIRFAPRDVQEDKGRGPAAGRGLASQVTCATITGADVGARVPPAGSSVTSTALIPLRLPGTPTAADPLARTPNNVPVGVGAALPRCTHIS